MELKPQQTGTRLLPGRGEVATTSGSTILRSEPTSGWVRVKDALHSLGEGGPLAVPAQSYGWQAHSTASWCNRSMPGFDPDGLGANPSEAAKAFQPVSSKSERQSYKLRTLESYQHGPPFLLGGDCDSRSEQLRFGQPFCKAWETH